MEGASSWRQGARPSHRARELSASRGGRTHERGLSAALNSSEAHTNRPAALRSLQRRAHLATAIFTPAQRDAFSRDGFVALENVLSPDDAAALAEHYSALFAGEFPTGIYPDEWHWREGISLPLAFREIVNGWKSSPLVARVALAPALGRAASELMGWSAGARIAQDDVLWKVPGGGGGVGWHTDAAAIR